MDNKSILLEANKAVTNGNHQGFLNFCTDDIVWNFVGDQILKGKESIKNYMDETYVTPPKFEIKVLVAESDYVTVTGEIRLQNKSGKFIKYSYYDVWRFENGKVAELKAFVIAD